MTDISTPSLTLSSPVEGAVLKDSVKLEALATDETQLTKVEFFIDSASLEPKTLTELVAPYVAILDTKTLPDGPHTLYAVATDSSGNKAQTKTIDVGIHNAPIVVPDPDPIPNPIPDPIPTPIDSGWTEFKQTPETKKFYVSSSLGSDANDGSEAKPLKTLFAGYAKLVSGKPHWLLLKRGDTWNEQFPQWNKSGRSESEPMLISSYGVGLRPIVSSTGPVLLARAPKPGGVCNVSFVAVTGIRLTNLLREPGRPGFNPNLKSDAAIRWMSTGESLHIEDNLVDFHRVGIVLEQTGFKNLKIRRNVVTNNWAKVADGHSQGAYISDVTDILIEGNIVDQNGFLSAPGVTGAVRTIFNHGIYMQASNFGVIKVAGNVFSRNSATGLQMRSGGYCGQNTFLQNPVGLTYGFTLGGHAAMPGGISGKVENNLWLEGTDISSTLPRGVGMSIGNIKATVVVSGNIWAHCNSPKKFHGSVEVECGKGGGILTQGALIIKDNIMYKWDPPMRFSGGCAPKCVQANNISSGDFPKPDQKLVDFDKDFFIQARKQSRVSWSDKYTSKALLAFFSKGFGK